ncbi:aspartate kinase [Pedobacter sp. SAFR-022]|uniref:aspartate kinase n=1 Tax=Pedobacter sp. SAFR-022 TaxID=3436861 RepID=UPI003F7F25AB
MQVYKFGGASIKNADAIRNVSEILKGVEEDQLLIVISAIGQTTNKLVALTNAYLNLQANVNDLLEDIKQDHFTILQDLFGAGNHRIFDEVSNAFVEVEWLLEDEPADTPDYIYDQIVSIGEVVSSKIMAAYLNEVGCMSTWVDARNYIKTDNNYREANVDWHKTELEMKRTLPAILNKGYVITQGFIGGTSENFTTTLGREGSDYSAAIFSACLDATALTIWKDVPGVLNADPKWFERTEKIPELSYHDAIELTYYGATVIHPKTIKPLQNHNIPLFVRSFKDPGEPGTKISSVAAPVNIPSFIFKVNQVLISIMPKDLSFIIEENLSDIFQIFHGYKVKVNTMHNSAVSFSISADYEENEITKLIAELSNKYHIKYNTGVELVTIRYYNQSTIDRVTLNKDILLEIKSRHTCQLLMKNKPSTE